jgi:hypothetical protein
MPAVSKIINGRTWINGLGDSVSTWGLGGGQAAINWFEMMGDVLTQIGLERQTTSTTSLAVGSGSKVFTLAANANFPIGAVVIAAVTASPATNWMFGVVTAYNAGTPSVTLSVAADGFGGSGTYAAWTLSVAGQKGQTGAGVPSMTGHANKVLSNNGATADFRFTELQYSQANALTPTFSANITLTASSEMMQVLAPTVAGLSVTLPDATTLLKHPERFVLLNSGNFEFAVRNSAGTLITVVLPGGRARMALSDISTAAGAWFASGDKLSPFFWKMLNATISGGGSQHIRSTIYLSETLCVFISEASSTMYATAYDVANNTLGTTTSLGAIGATLYFTGAMDATRGLVVANTSTVAFSVSGTTITVGNLITTPASMEQAIILSATQAMLVSNTGLDKLVTGLYLPAAPSVTLAAGAATAVYTAASGGSAPIQVSAVKRSATQVILAGCNNGNSAKAVHVSISGTTPFTGITKDSEVVFTGGKGAGVYYGAVCSNLVFMATDEWWCFYWEVSDRIAVGKITVSGVTLSFTQGSAFITGASAPIFQGSLRAPSIVKTATNKIAGSVGLSAGAQVIFYIGTLTSLVSASAAQLGGYVNGFAGAKPELLPTSGDFCGYFMKNDAILNNYVATDRLTYIDETFPGDAMAPLASIYLSKERTIISSIFVRHMRMTNFDIIIGNTDVDAGRALMINRTGQRIFKEVAIPAIWFYTLVAGVPFAHVGANKLAFGGYNGKVHCVEVAL